EYQEIDGFGFSLTGGSAYHIFNMSAASRNALLTELFDYTGNNIGTSYLRVSIGASDLDFEVFSYNDLPSGETDVNMEKFSLDRDREYLIPVLKEILSINPDIKIMGSPWSAPVWMKTNQNSIGGSLKKEYFGAYAKYFVKYIQEMKAEGIKIDAITVQNEPLHPGNNPSMYMTAEDQALFIKDHLGPAFRDNNITTKIIIYDHNADRIDYPMSILNDQDARKFIDGSAFHLYGGQINDLYTLYSAHPDKNLYFTEQWVGAGSEFGSTFKWHVWNLIIGATRNYCRTVLEWNLAADENQDPHTPGGCDRCLGAVTISGDAVTRNPAYYIIAQASKFVRPGSHRVESNLLNDLSNVAFKTPDGKIVIIVLNTISSSKAFNIKVGTKQISSELAPGAAGTYIFGNN
ncbi:MAG: glycoside hydrolase family 30 beta sandwich domain-containing protein, partial [Melioribacteraceae bacterium]|nr:glycoside hydrolase family 30 beta sandwich domain-containing protein [Melioribacteraceae bacterium]